MRYIARGPPGREGNTARGVAECCIFPRDWGPECNISHTVEHKVQ